MVEGASGSWEVKSEEGVKREPGKGKASLDVVIIDA